MSDSLEGVPVWTRLSIFSPPVPWGVPGAPVGVMDELGTLLALEALRPWSSLRRPLPLLPRPRPMVCAAKKLEGLPGKDDVRQSLSIEETD